jgi:hypothetical protein
MKPTNTWAARFIRGCLQVGLSAGVVLIVLSLLVGLSILVAGLWLTLLELAGWSA